MKYVIVLAMFSLSLAACAQPGDDAPLSSGQALASAQKSRGLRVMGLKTVAVPKFAKGATMGLELELDAPLPIGGAMPVIEVGGKLYPQIGGTDPKRPTFGIDATALSAAAPHTIWMDERHADARRSASSSL